LAGDRVAEGVVGSAIRLNSSEIAEIMRSLPKWQLVDGREAITRDFLFSGFMEAWSFMGKIANKAEQMGHHPEWSNVYNKVCVTLATHDCGGLSGLDIEMALFIDGLELT
jgi:4a-hydroxytetrahydrobiopterin dehydratase